MEPGKISQRQLVYLMLTVLFTTMIFFLPRMAAQEVEQDAWLIPIIATIWGALVVLIMVAMWRRFPDKTLTGYLPLIIGKPLGLILGLLYALWFLLVGSVVVMEFAYFLNSSIMPYTPVVVIVVSFMALVFYALRSGLEVWVRINEIILWVVIASFLVVVLLPYKFMDFGRLLPVAAHSVGSLMAGSLIGGSWRGEVVIVGMLLPALVNSKNTSRSLLLVVLLIGLAAAVVKISVVAVFGGVVTGQLEFPVFSLARIISIAKIVARLEVLVVTIWVFGTFVKVCAFMYCSARAISESLGFKEYQFLTLPLSILTVALAINMYTNVAEFVDFLNYSFVGFGILTFELTIPALLLIIAVLRKRRQQTT